MTLFCYTIRNMAIFLIFWNIGWSLKMNFFFWLFLIISLWNLTKYYNSNLVRLTERVGIYLEHAHVFAVLHYQKKTTSLNYRSYLILTINFNQYVFKDLRSIKMFNFNYIIKDLFINFDQNLIKSPCDTIHDIINEKKNKRKFILIILAIHYKLIMIFCFGKKLKILFNTSKNNE